MRKNDLAFQAHKRMRGGRDRVLSAASELFQAHNVGGTSLQMIADRLGVSKAAIYYHFKSREEILVALMTPVIVHAEGAINEIVSLDAPARSSAAHHLILDLMIQYRDIVSTFFFDRPALGYDLSHKIDELIDLLVKFMATGDRVEDDARARIRLYGVAGFIADERGRELTADTLRTLLSTLLLGAPEQP